MNKELIAIELTKLYINNQDYIKTEQQILNIFLSFYNSLCKVSDGNETK